MQNPPEVIEPLTGYIALIAVGVLAYLAYRVIRAYARRRAARSHTIVGIAVHAAGSHHPTGGVTTHTVHHGGHPAHEKEPLWKRVVGWSTAIAVGIILAVVVLWFVAVPLGLGLWHGFTTSRDHSPDNAEVVVRTAVRASPVQAVCTPTATEWRPVTAPSKGEMSEALRPPPCHRFWFCDKTQDPKCEAESFADARFTLWCTTPEHATPQLYNHERDTVIEACYVQSKDGTPVELEYTYEYAPPV